MIETFKFNLAVVTAFTFYMFLNKIRKMRRQNSRLDQSTYLVDDDVVHIEYYINNEKALTVRIRRDDLYMIGYQSAKSLIWWEMRESEDQDQLIMGSESIKCTFKYPDFNNVHLGFNYLKEHIIYFRDVDNPNAEIVETQLRYALVVLHTIEPARLSWVSYPLGPVAQDPDSVLQFDDGHIKTVRRWSKISKRAKRCLNKDIDILSEEDIRSIVERNIVELLQPINMLSQNEYRKARVCAQILCLTPNKKKKNKTAKKKKNKDEEEKKELPRITPGLPRAPQGNAGVPASEATGPSTPTKDQADASRGFSLQFGSISPSLMNGMQVPARTSSAPPKFDEHKQAQALREPLKSVKAPTPFVPKQELPKKDAGPVNQPKANEVHLIPKPKKDVQTLPSLATLPQKLSGPPISGIPMQAQITIHHPQLHVQYGGLNPQMQSQGMTYIPLPIPLPIGSHQVQQPVFVAGSQHHPMQQPQRIIHQGQSLNFPAQIGPPQMPLQLGSMGIGLGQHYPQQQTGKHSAHRKTVKITHPDTHEEVRLDGAGPRSTHSHGMSQSQGGLARGMSVRGQSSIQSMLSSEPTDSRRVAPGPNSFGSRDDLGARYISEQLTPQPAYGLSYANRDTSNPEQGFDHGASSSQVTTFSQNVSSDKVWREGRLNDMLMQAIEEFYSARDEKEVALSIKDLNAPSYYPSMISIWVSDSFKRKDVDRDSLTKLLVNLAKAPDGMLNQGSYIQGFKAVLATLEDSVSNAPRAAEYFGRILGKLLIEDVISYKEVWRLIYEGGKEQRRLVEIGLAAEVLGVILERIKSEKGDLFLNEVRAGSNPKLKEFRPPNIKRPSRLDKFI